MSATAERTHVHAFIDRQDHDRLRELAEQNGRSKSAEIRRAIAAYLERPYGLRTRGELDAVITAAAAQIIEEAKEIAS